MEIGPCTLETETVYQPDSTSLSSAGAVMLTGPGLHPVVGEQS